MIGALRDAVRDADTILIAGHIRPDGDCVGACTAAYCYLSKIFPEKKIHAYLESIPDNYAFLDREQRIFSRSLPAGSADIFLAVDSSTADILGAAQAAFYAAKETVCIDHHASNQGYADRNFIDRSASSACEVLFAMLEEECLDRRIAEALYIGIIFDTGVFRYSNTSPKTMEIAGKLMGFGFPFWEYIDKCYAERTYTQIQLLGRALLASMRLMNGTCIVSYITRRILQFYGAKEEDVEGIVEQMRVTKGVEVAILILETGEQEYKVSMRSNHSVDVSRVAVYFGGGGHRKAAGCTMYGSSHDVMNNLSKQIALQMPMDEW